MSTSDSLNTDFKQLVDLQVFAEAQTKTILELNKKISKLQQEKLDLEKVLSESKESTIKEVLNIGDSDEEIISKIQLSKIKEVSYGRELTLEEAKRVEIFSKILINSSTPKKQKDKAAIYSTEDLLKIVD